MIDHYSCLVKERLWRKLLVTFVYGPIVTWTIMILVFIYYIQGDKERENGCLELFFWVDFAKEVNFCWKNTIYTRKKHTHTWQNNINSSHKTSLLLRCLADTTLICEYVKEWCDKRANALGAWPYKNKGPTQGGAKCFWWDG